MKNVLLLTKMSCKDAEMPWDFRIESWSFISEISETRQRQDDGVAVLSI